MEAKYTVIVSHMHSWYYVGFLSNAISAWPTLPCGNIATSSLLRCYVLQTPKFKIVTWLKVQRLNLLKQVPFWLLELLVQHDPVKERNEKRLQFLEM